MIRFLRNFMGRRREDQIKELVNEVDRELGMEERQDSRDSDQGSYKKGNEESRN